MLTKVAKVRKVFLLVSREKKWNFTRKVIKTLTINQKFFSRHKSWRSMSRWRRLAGVSARWLARWRQKAFWWLHTPWKKLQLFALPFSNWSESWFRKDKALCAHTLLTTSSPAATSMLTTLLLHMLFFRFIWRFSSMSTLGWDNKWKTFNWRNYIASRLFSRLRHNEPINYAQKLVLQLDAAVECFWRWLLIRQARSLSRYTNSWIL